MDGSLNAEILETGKNQYELIDSILQYSNLVKRSGFSVIWHNTSLVGTEFSDDIKETFWKIVENSKVECITCMDLVLNPCM